jgi:hypothetical protein
LWLPDSTSNISISNLIYLHVLHKKWSNFYILSEKSDSIIEQILIMGK